jgi:hypothetical protein
MLEEPINLIQSKDNRGLDSFKPRTIIILISYRICDPTIWTPIKKEKRKKKRNQDEHDICWI